MVSNKILLSILVCIGMAAQTPPPAPPSPEVPKTEPTEKPTQEPSPTPATLPQAPEAPETKPAEPTKPAESIAPVPVEAKAILLFYRESRFMGGGLRPSIYVDNIEVAWLSSGSYFKVAVTPGDHVIYADEKDDALTFPTEPGKTYYFRVGIRAGLFKGHGKLEPVSEEAGAKEFEGWKPKMTYTEKILKPEMVVKD
jgi:hypothetical protein